MLDKTLLFLDDNAAEAGDSSVLELRGADRGTMDIVFKAGSVTPVGSVVADVKTSADGTTYTTIGVVSASADEIIAGKKVKLPYGNSVYTKLTVTTALTSGKVTVGLEDVGSADTFAAAMATL